MVNMDAVSPSTVISTINKKNPQCPVLLRPISVKYLSDRERLMSAFNSCSQIIDFNNFNLTHKGKLFANEMNMLESIPFVFTACGHVHAYSKELIGRSIIFLCEKYYNSFIFCRPCPLCRAKGSFTQLIFPFVAGICGVVPTHVFNPCGHAASEEVRF